jgi:hypothetical protein
VLDDDEIARLHLGMLDRFAHGTDTPAGTLAASRRAVNSSTVKC